MQVWGSSKRFLKNLLKNCQFGRHSTYKNPRSQAFSAPKKVTSAPEPLEFQADVAAAEEKLLRIFEVGTKNINGNMVLVLLKKL